MGIETDLNVSPYYDDYDESKDYHKVLFKPAVALQARELTQAQTILQTQIERFGQHIFKEGSIIKGCAMTFDNQIRYVKILDKTVAGTDVNTANITEGMFLRGQTANLVSRVSQSASGLESQNPDLNTIFFNYIKSDNTTTDYANGEILEVYAATTSIANIQVTAIGDNYNNTDTVSISSTNGGNATATVNTYSNGSVESITVTANGTGFTADDYPTASVSGNSTADGATLRVNLNEEMRVTVGNSSFFDSGGNTQFNVTGKGYEMKVQDGVVFQKGHFQRFAEQNIIVSKYTNKPHERVVGIETTESTVNNSVDTTLLDNASGYANENAPGADRLKLVPTLSVNSKAVATAANNFLKIAEFQHGEVIQRNQNAVLSSLGDAIAQRTYEESGDYVVDPFVLSTEERVGNTTHSTLTIGEGTGYIQGKRFELTGTTRIPYAKATSTANADPQQVSINYGNYVDVDELIGQFGAEENDMVLILDTAMNSISANVNPTLPAASNTSVAYNGTTGNVVGTARVRSLEQNGDVPGKFNNKYKLYLSDIKMNAGKAFRKHAKSFWHYKQEEYDLTKATSGSENNQNFSGVCDAVLDSGITKLKDAKFNKLVFPVGQKGIKAVGSAGDYTFRKRSTATAAANGTLVVSLSDANQTFGYGDAALNETQEKELIIVPTASINSSATLTAAADVANSTVKTVTGIEAGRTDALKAGDFVFVDTTLCQVNNVINSTAFNTVSAVGASKTNVNVLRTFPAGYPISLNGRTYANATTSSSGQTLTIELGMTSTSDSHVDLSGTVACAVHHNVVDTSEAGRTKAYQTSEIAIDCANNAATNAGPWCLGIPDAHELVSVLVGPDNTYTSVAESDWADKTAEFEILDGQTNAKYGLSYLRLKPSSNYSLTTSNHLAVKFRHFKESGSGKGFFSYQSYHGIIDDANTANTTAITTQAIPVFVSPNDGQEYSLRDSIDFRPYVENTATYGGAFSNGVGTATENPVVKEIINASSFVSTPNKIWASNVEYYLPRKDRIVINNSGIKIIEGEPSTNPQLPQMPVSSMQIGTVDTPVYPTLSVAEGSFYKRPDLASKIKATQLRRYTMHDIKKIDDRVNNLEYYTSLNMLEKMTKDEVIPGRTDPTLNRFKNGFIVDNFASATTGNPLNAEYKAGFDTARNLLTPKWANFDIELKYNDGASVNKFGDTIFPRFEERPIISQDKASQDRRCTSQYWKYNGTLKIFPDYVGHFDNQKKPLAPVQIDVDVASGTIALLEELQKVVPMQFTSDEIINEERTTRLTSSTETDTTRTDTYETIIDQQIERTTANITAKTNSTTKQVGSFVTDVSFQPYIPGVLIRFVAAGLRPGLRHYVYFDDVDVNEHVMPAKINNTIDDLDALETLTSTRVDKMVWKTNAKGTALTADASGVIAGHLHLPAGTFFVGERKMVVADVSNLSQVKDTVSSATARFNCYNFSVNTQDLNITTRTPEFGSSISSRILNSQRRFTEEITSTVPRNTDPTANGTPSGNGQSNSTIGTPGANTDPGGIGRPPMDDPCFDIDPDREWDRSGFPNPPMWDPIDVFCDGYTDPLSQTFLIDKNFFGTSAVGYLTSLDLFFSSKDPSMGVTVQLQETKNGVPAAKVLPFSSVDISSSNIETSTDGSTATRINFKAPVAVKAKTEYAIVIMPKGNSPEYKVWTAKAGQKDKATNKVMNQDWGKGTMFLSTNNRTWTEYLDEDLKFTVNAAKFTDLNSHVDLVNKDYEFIQAKDLTTNGTFKPKEEVFQLKANSSGNVAINAGNSTIIGTGTDFTSPALAAGDKIVLTGNTTTFDVVEIDSVSNSTHLVLRDAPKFTFAASAGRYMFTPTGRINQVDANTGTIMVEESTSANDTFKFAANSTANVVIGCDSNANVTANAYLNINLSYHEPALYTSQVPGTNVKTLLKARNAADTGNTAFKQIKLNDRNYPLTPIIVKSKSNEISGTTLTKSLGVRHELDSVSQHTAPYIDMQTQELKVYENIINNDTTNEHLTNVGNATSKYVSRVVTLADGLDAEDIKLFINAYRPANTDIKVYAKILNETDETSLDDTRWSQLDMTQNKDLFSSEVERRDVIEYGFEFNDTPESTAAASGGTVQVTSGDATITGVGTTFDDDYDVGDLIKITRTDSSTDYFISKIVTATSNTALEVADTAPFTDTTGLTHSKVDSAFVNQAFRDPNAPTPFQVTYYNNSGEKFIGYKKLQIKIVLTTASTGKAPQLQDFRALAVSL